MVFEWDTRKSASSLRKHGVSFAEVGTVFGDELSITVPDPDHSDQEDRYITIGWSNLHRLLIVAHSEAPCGHRPQRKYPNHLRS